MSKSKKLLSVLLACCLAFSAISISLVAFADDKSADTASTAEVVEVTPEKPDAQAVEELVDEHFNGDNQAFATFTATMAASISGENALEVPEWLKNIIEGAISSGALEGAIDQIMKWIATIVTNDPNPENFMEAWEYLKEHGITIGDIAQMTDEEVKVMLDQIYWVYADNPGPITQTVDCIKMLVNLIDAYIHATAQDVGPLNPMMSKLVTYYYNWLKEHCGLGWIPDLPELPTTTTTTTTTTETPGPGPGPESTTTTTTTTTTTETPGPGPGPESTTTTTTTETPGPGPESTTTTTTTEKPVTPGPVEEDSTTTTAPASVANVDNGTKSPATGSASDAALMVSTMIAFICATGAAIVFVRGKKQKDF